MNSNKIADGIKAGSRIIGNAGALIQSGGQTLESVGNLYDSYVKDGEIISWKNATDLITLGLSVAGMGMAGKSLAKDGKALKAVSQGNVNVKPAAVSNSTASSGRFKMDLQMFAKKSGKTSNRTLLSGEEWYRYFQDTYGTDNVNWNVSSFDDMLRHPTSLRGYSADEIGQILGAGWTRDTYGSNGSGWKFIENAHSDNMVFYHGGGGVHEGAYRGVKSGKTGTIKIVNTATYVPLSKDKATIVYREDW